MSVCLRKYTQQPAKPRERFCMPRIRFNDTYIKQIIIEIIISRRNIHRITHALQRYVMTL